jgi:hypothetical protein
MLFLVLKPFFTGETARRDTTAISFIHEQEQSSRFFKVSYSSHIVHPYEQKCLQFQILSHLILRDPDAFCTDILTHPLFYQSEKSCNSSASGPKFHSESGNTMVNTLLSACLDFFSSQLQHLWQDFSGLLTRSIR